MNITDIFAIYWLICFPVAFLIESYHDKRAMNKKFGLMIVLGCLGFLLVPFYLMDKPEIKDKRNDYLISNEQIEKELNKILK